MKTCPNCGATLADNAQYCMQCGTSTEPPVQEAAPLSTGAFLGPALISGTAMGILATIPFVSCLCCAWFLGGGGLAAWLVGKRLAGGARKLTFGDGAFAGVLAGVWGAVIATLAGIPIRMLSADSLAEAQAQIEAVFSENPEVPDWIRELAMNMVSQDVTALGLLIGLFFNLVIYGLFAMIGGILLVAIVRKPRA